MLRSRLQQLLLLLASLLLLHCSRLRRLLVLPTSLQLGLRLLLLCLSRLFVLSQHDNVRDAYFVIGED